MIRKLLIIILCLIVSSCGGVTFVTGLNFKKEVESGANGGNPGFTSDSVKLSSGKFIGFARPMGNCGAGVTFFGIALPIIPIKFTFNNCDENFYIKTESKEILNLKLKYGDNVYEAISIKKITKDEYRKEFRFKILDFSDFKAANDVVIIVVGDNFTQELPVKWGVMTYNNWSFP